MSDTESDTELKEPFQVKGNWYSASAETMIKHYLDDIEMSKKNIQWREEDLDKLLEEYSKPETTSKRKAEISEEMDDTNEDIEDLKANIKLVQRKIKRLTED